MAHRLVSRIPKRLPAVAEDRFIYADRFLRTQAIHIIVSFDGRVDENRLDRSVRTVMDAEPVFGCRYVPGRAPYWERRTDLDNLPLCTLAPSSDVIAELEDFVATPTSATSDPLVQMRLVRAASDTLLFKANHVAVDGAGSQELLARIASIYRNPANPEALVPNFGRRGSVQLFRHVGLGNCLRSFRAPLIPAPQEWRFPTAVPADLADEGPLRIAMRRVPLSAFETLYAYAKSRGATLNDIFLAALFRALWRFLDFPFGIPRGISIPVDMRQYLPSRKTEAITNFTVPLFPNLARVPHESFPDTLLRLKDSVLAPHNRQQCALRKMLFLALLYRCFSSGMERAIAGIRRKDHVEGRTRVVFSNTGTLLPDLLDFGLPITDAYRVLPASLAPGLFLTAGSFRQRLTFSITYPSHGIRCDDIERFLDTFLEELPESAGLAAPLVSDRRTHRTDLLFDHNRV